MTPPTMGPTFELDDDEDEEDVAVAPDDFVLVLDCEPEVVVVWLFVVEAHFVKVLLSDAAKSVVIVSFV